VAIKKGDSSNVSTKKILTGIMGMPYLGKIRVLINGRGEKCFTSFSPLSSRLKLFLRRDWRKAVACALSSKGKEAVANISIFNSFFSLGYTTKRC
jgi:hypothetical protein